MVSIALVFLWNIWLNSICSQISPKNRHFYLHPAILTPTFHSYLFSNYDKNTSIICIHMQTLCLLQKECMMFILLTFMGKFWALARTGHKLLETFGPFWGLLITQKVLNGTSLWLVISSLPSCLFIDGKIVCLGLNWGQKMDFLYFMYILADPLAVSHQNSDGIKKNNHWAIDINKEQLVVLVGIILWTKCYLNGLMGWNAMTLRILRPQPFFCKRYCPDFQT